MGAEPGLKSTKEGPSRAGIGWKCKTTWAGFQEVTVVRQHGGWAESGVKKVVCRGEGKICGPLHMDIEVSYGPWPHMEKQLIKWTSEWIMRSLGQSCSKGYKNRVGLPGHNYFQAERGKESVASSDQSVIFHKLVLTVYWITTVYQIIKTLACNKNQTS